MNLNKQSACHVASKHTVSWVDELAGEACIGARAREVRMARRRCASVHGPPVRPRSARGSPSLLERLVCAPTEPAREERA
jgi:hypothetical protein